MARKSNNSSILKGELILDIGAKYLEVIVKEFEKTKKLADRTIEQLNETEFFWMPDKESNSIAIIVKHISGNSFSRWTDFLTSDGEKENRSRDDEFIQDGDTMESVLTKWDLAWHLVFQTLSELKNEDLLKTVYIRGEAYSVMEAIERQVSHYAYHVGQIVYIGKMLKQENWNTLSIPRGQSEQFRLQMIQKHSKK